MARQMVGWLHAPGKHQASGLDTSAFGFLFEIFDRRLILRQQPKDAAVDGLQDTHPTPECFRGDLEVVVEATKNKTIRRKSEFAALEGLIGDGSGSVIRLIAGGEFNQLLRI